MRVAMVSEHASPLATLGGVDAGGQNVFVDALSRELARRGCEVVVYTRRDDPTLPRRLALCPGVEVEHVPAGPAVELPKDELFPHMARFAAGLAHAWRRRRPDLVHAHFWMSGHASLLAAESMGLPVVQTFHALGTVKRRYQGGMDTSPPRRLEVERQIVAEADRVLATCSDEVFELMRMGADGERVTVVPCGVDLGVFDPAGPAEEREPGLRRLLYVGRLVRRKGVGNVIEALPRMPGVELVVAGGPPRDELDRDPEARRLAELAERHGVAERVRMRGRVDRERLPALIRSADAVVAVPWYEPFGIVPLEAMACGVPVIASAVGGMIDSVVDGQTGIHVPPRDPERLAEAALELLADRERCRAYGQAGAKRAQRLYDWRRVGRQVLEAYGTVLGGREAGRRRDGGRSQGGQAHLEALAGGIAVLEAERPRIDAWGEWLGERLLAGGRLLAAGNGGSAAEAQHLTAELVGRFQAERRPLSAIALHADTSSLTAIGNDYGVEEVFARQVEAHGRVGDVLVALSTSGRSENLLRAVAAANRVGLVTWAVTGPRPNPLADACDEAIALEVDSGATVQELHLVVVHLLCGAVDRCVRQLDGEARPSFPPAPVRQLSWRGRRFDEARGFLMSDRLVVVGDALLDRDVDGVSERLAPDSGVPVLDQREARARPGGAGLAAAIAAAEGRDVTLVTALADDEAGSELASLLALAGVRLVDLGLDGPTPEKVRLLEGGRPRLRLDRGGAGAPLLARNRDGLRRALEGAGAILVSDYGRGVAADEPVRAALAAARPGRPLVWDPHPRGPAPLPGAALATPNLDEATRLAPSAAGDCGVEPAIAGSTPQSVRGGPRAAGELAAALLAAWAVEAVCVTRGAEGALLAEPGEPVRELPCAPARGDPCGAGDSFAVAAATALAGGATPGEAAAAAVESASEFVAASGARRLSTPGGVPELGGLYGTPNSETPDVLGTSDAVDLRGIGAAPRSIAPALALAARVRARDGTVVATGGCFDLLHVGHVRTLEAARALGDCLVVLLNGDRSVRRLKGADRPLVGELERAAMLKALSCVDEVAIFDEPVPDEALRLLRPEVWAKGGDYEAGELPEAEAIAAWGGRVAILPYLEGRSTTRLIEEVGARAER